MSAEPSARGRGWGWIIGHPSYGGTSKGWCDSCGDQSPMWLTPEDYVAWERGAPVLCERCALHFLEHGHVPMALAKARGEAER